MALPASELFVYGGVWIVGSAFACWTGSFYSGGREELPLQQRKRMTIGPALVLALSITVFIWDRQSAIDTACDGIREAAERFDSGGSGVPNRLFGVIPGLEKASDICKASW